MLQGSPQNHGPFPGLRSGTSYFVCCSRVHRQSETRGLFVLPVPGFVRVTAKTPVCRNCSVTSPKKLAPSPGSHSLPRQTTQMLSSLCLCSVPAVIEPAWVLFSFCSVRAQVQFQIYLSACHFEAPSPIICIFCWDSLISPPNSLCFNLGFSLEWAQGFVSMQSQSSSNPRSQGHGQAELCLGKHQGGGLVF